MHKETTWKMERYWITKGNLKFWEATASTTSTYSRAGFEPSILGIPSSHLTTQPLRTLGRRGELNATTKSGRGGYPTRNSAVGDNAEEKGTVAKAASLRRHRGPRQRLSSCLSHLCKRVPSVLLSRHRLPIQRGRYEVPGQS